MSSSVSIASTMQRTADNLSTLQMIADEFQAGRNQPALKIFNDEIPAEIQRSIFRQVWVDDGSKSSRERDYGRKAFFGDGHLLHRAKNVQAIQRYINRIRPSLPPQFQETRLHSWLVLNKEVRLIRRGSSMEWHVVENDRNTRYPANLGIHMRDHMIRSGEIILSPNGNPILQESGIVVDAWMANAKHFTLLRKTDKLEFRVRDESLATSWTVPVDCSNEDRPLDQITNRLTSYSKEFEDGCIAFGRNPDVCIWQWKDQKIRLVERDFYELNPNLQNTAVKRVYRLALERFEPTTNAYISTLQYPALPNDSFDLVSIPLETSPKHPRAALTLEEQHYAWYVHRVPVVSNDNQLRFRFTPQVLLHSIAPDFRYGKVDDALRKFKYLPTLIKNKVFERVWTIHGKPSHTPDFGKRFFYDKSTNSWTKAFAIADQRIELTLADLRVIAEDFRNGNANEAYRKYPTALVPERLESKVRKRIYELDGSKSPDRHFGLLAFHSRAYTDRVSHSQRSQAIMATLRLLHDPNCLDSYRRQLFFGPLFEFAMTSSIPYEPWVEKIPAVFDKTKMITESHWGVTLADIGDREIVLTLDRTDERFKHSPATWFGHSGIFIETVENGEYEIHLAQFFGHRERTGHGYVKLEKLNKPTTQHYKTKYKTDTWIVSAAKAKKMLKVINKQAIDVESGRCPLRYQAKVTIKNQKNENTHNCATWAKQTLAIADITPPPYDGWFSSYIATTPAGEVYAAQNYKPNSTQKSKSKCACPSNEPKKPITWAKSIREFPKWLYSQLPSFPSVIFSPPSIKEKPQ